MNYTRPAWLEINLDNIKYNLEQIRKNIDPNSEIMAVIKANAYGHGAIELAKLYKTNGINYLVVSVLSEALELRGAGIKGPILMLNYTPAYQYELVVKNDLIVAIYNFDDAFTLSEVAQSNGKIAKIHINIDSGMGRLGFVTDDKTIEEIEQIINLPNLDVEGIFTHFSRSDESDKAYSNIQMERFKWLIDELDKREIHFKFKHSSNSAAVIDMHQYNMDMVRPGLMLYGYYPSEEVDKTKINLKPAMTLKAKISNVKKVPTGSYIGYGQNYMTDRESIIATIPLGYADGYSRLLSNKGKVSINGKLVPVVGNICMDQMMVNVTGLDDVNIGDEVILFGGLDAPKLEDLAKAMNTIVYDLLTMMGRRLPRVYLQDKIVVNVIDYLLNF